MAVTDTYLRSQATAQATDLWLHPAGAAGGLAPYLYASGMVTTAAQLDALDSLRDTGLVTTIGQLAALESLAGAVGGVVPVLEEPFTALSDYDAVAETEQAALALTALYRADALTDGLVDALTDALKGRAEAPEGEARAKSDEWAAADTLALIAEAK